VAPSLDPEARFEAMVNAHYARLGVFAYRLVGSRPAAEDVVHEVLLRVWRRRASFGFDTALPYLYQAVRNEATSWRRREALGRQRTAGAVDGAAQADPRPDAQRGLELSELAHAVEETVAALPERRREIFRMQREQGLSYAQIASLLGISIKTVEVQMGRALKAIRLRAAPFLVLTIALLK
jgi:RNA polymerase sigma-70 factor (ECF subfamily)